MKRKSILFFIVALLLIITGCSNQSKTNTKQTKKPTTEQSTKVLTSEYDKLSKKDSDKVKFGFRYYHEENSDLEAVDVKIDNQTDKKIGFEKQKFIFIGSRDVKSNRSGQVTAQPGKKLSIKGIFTKIDSSFFEEPGLLVYGSSEHKLAYIEQSTKQFSSDNLSNQILINNYKKFYANRDAWEQYKNSYKKNSSESTAQESSNDNTKTSSDTSSNNDVVHNEQEAQALVEKQNGSAADLTDNADGAHYTYNYGMWDTDSEDKVYWIKISIPMGDVASYPYSWIVYPDGRVVSGSPNEN